ncbi:hypothetical protein AB1Y20_013905 [Prymnesium parvum]|uniref:Uncharacterized protein n=1 Tax=Prymnesium parvum TaxID=97485 RepID=A0AB34IH40_PRYPA
MSSAFLASQINGGGCLPPPTPREVPKTLIELIADAASKNNVAAYGERKVAKGWETTTMRMLREGASKETTSAADSDLPSTIAEYGMMIIEGKATLIPRDRRTGELLHWRTSSMAANEQVYGNRAHGGWGLPSS